LFKSILSFPRADYSLVKRKKKGTSPPSPHPFQEIKKRIIKGEGLEKQRRKLYLKKDGGDFKME